MNNSQTTNANNYSNIEQVRLWRIVVINLAIWLAICTIGATGNYQDSINGHGLQANQASFLRIWRSWINVHVPLFFLTSTLYYLLGKHPKWISQANKIVRMFVALSLLFFPLHLAYISLPRWYSSHEIHSISNLITHIGNLDNFTWFLEFAWFTGSFAVTIAVRIWHLGQERIQLLQQTQQSNLSLSLALEQQRLRSLQQQLEPHFIFNALNAISALVRGNEKSIALHGIQKLSELLRYALKASKHEVVRFADEVQFLKDYLALQGLRYGERLQFSFDGLTHELERGDCPPLLLQPIIENALRHDLDCHDGLGKIMLNFSLENGMVTIHISNTRGDPESRNPGLGLGLSQTHERLSMLYGSLASLQVLPKEKVFSVVITMPLYRKDIAL